MDNSFMVGLSAQQILRQRMDVTANNLANMTTAGFKAESVITRPLSEAPATASDTPNDIAFADAWTLQRDFSAGEMERTGNPLDLAIEGEGFFSVQTPAGPAYTRDGRFSLDAAGQLVTRAGQPVLSGGGPLILDPTAGNVAVARDGSVSQNGLLVGALDIVAFDTPAALEKLGDNLWRATDEAPRPPQALRVASGFIEGSNVNAIEQITQMIEISRTYQSVSKMISQADELRATSIEKLARVG
ncbi:MAG: flagellar basal-body rod protein FlgF [Alphaproteobacteria bacterium]|nr:flagellar basal-body rod protein FlgF [Alphaproteobacteria bacterium]